MPASTGVPPSHEGDWNWCAEYYLHEIWLQDREIIQSFRKPLTCTALHKLCVDYKVARTIPGNGLDKYVPFAKMIERYRDVQMTTRNVPAIVDQETQDMAKVYGKNFISAISKALWMLKQHPIVIYDSYAWKGLQRLGLSPGYVKYSSYYDAWFRFFDLEDTQRGILAAVRWVQSSPSAELLLKSGRITTSELLELAGSDTFANRVCDRRLVYLGGLVYFT